MARRSDIEESSIYTQARSGVCHAETNHQFRRNVTPDGRRVAEVPAPDDGVDEINKVAHKRPEDIEQGAKVARLPMPGEGK